MVDDAVAYIVAQLNQALKNQYALDEEIVVISNLSESSSLVTDDRMIATLVNIEREAFHAKSNSKSYNYQEQQTSKSYRPINLNLYLMFIANFHGEKYQEGLSFISSTIDFFQHNPVFDRLKHRAMPPGVDKLLMEIENLSLRELHSIWTLITGKYMPSILFKVRTISFDQGIQGLDPVATSLESSVTDETQRTINTELDPGVEIIEQEDVGGS